MSAPQSSGESNVVIQTLKALVIDLALMIYLVLSIVFVGHTILRSYTLLERNGYFDAQNANGQANDQRIGAPAFVYYMVARGIERNNLQNTTSWLLGTKPSLPGPNNGWVNPVAENLTLEVRHDPTRTALDIWALDARGGSGVRLDTAPTLKLKVDVGGETQTFELEAEPTSNQPGWTTKYALVDPVLGDIQHFSGTIVEIQTAAEAPPLTEVPLQGGAPGAPILALLVAAVVIAVVWSVLGWVGVFHAPGQRMMGLAPARELAPDAKPPSLFATFSGLFLTFVVLLTIAAGWFMIEVNLTNLTSEIRLNRMGNIFSEMFDFAKVQKNWQAAFDADPKTTSSWALFEEAVPKMIETLFLAMMATLFAIPIAFCLSFLAANNLMSSNPLTYGVYLVVRMMMNIVRSVEPLAWCIIASVWVGAGTFAGVLALAVHSIAALTKLYSEQIEGVDPGPMEAIRATGANGLQLLRYGVVPQIIPPFLSFTMYRWDINVRMAPILGFVGGGGIGVLLKQNFDQLNYANVGVIILLITILVAAMDFASASLRKKLI